MRAFTNFAGQTGVRAYVARQWQPGMMDSDTVPTAVFEVSEGAAVGYAPESLRRYDRDRRFLGMI